MDFTLALTEKKLWAFKFVFSAKILWRSVIMDRHFVYCTDLYKSNNNCSNFNANKLFYQEI